MVVNLIPYSLEVNKTKLLVHVDHVQVRNGSFMTKAGSTYRLCGISCLHYLGFVLFLGQSYIKSRLLK